MHDPQVSVIIPAYKCAETISCAIDSALSQEIPVEVLVINDCSPDDLDAVMECYREDSRVIYLKNEVNLGASGSRNRGVALARGKYVAFLDADDHWMPGKLRKQLEAIHKTGAVLCCTARELMNPTGEYTGWILPVRERITYRELLKHNSIACSSVLVCRDVAREFPMGHEDSHEDYIMWLQILKKYEFAAGVNEPLLKYRLTNTGKSGSKLKSAKMTFKVYRYMGFGWIQSLCCFVSYAYHGIRKYYFGEKHEA